ncbi:MAG: hypothetical protein QOE64_163 [Frankiales bacterium]|nr:hypothetical protein [Frankiales bacterium]
MATTRDDASQATKEAAKQAVDSKPVEWLARFGLVSRGVIWLIIGLLALQIAVGGGGEADRKGALRAIASKPLGHTMLVALLIGFCGYAIWRLLEAVAGHRDEEGAKRWVKRAASAGRGVLYGSFAYSVISFLSSGGGGKGDNTKPATVRVMSHTGGRWLVGAVGLAVLIGGLVIAVRGVRAKFLEKLKPLSSAMRTTASLLGRVGLVGRGLVIALVGWFLLHAALIFKASSAKGLDQSLKTLAGQPYGELLLGAAAIGLVSYGLWSFIEARYRKV